VAEGLVARGEWAVEAVAMAMAVAKVVAAKEEEVMAAGVGTVVAAMAVAEG
jgi:hypothetical protein